MYVDADTVDGQLKFINAEFSWGKWSGTDLKALSKPLLGVVSRIG